MSLVRLTAVSSVIRLTPEGDTSSTLVLRSQDSVIKLSQVGAQGAAGPPGPPGTDGNAEIPEVIDGGNF